jgi:hypothetical protein
VSTRHTGEYVLRAAHEATVPAPLDKRPKVAAVMGCTPIVGVAPHLQFTVLLCLFAGQQRSAPRRQTSGRGDRLCTAASSSIHALLPRDTARPVRGLAVGGVLSAGGLSPRYVSYREGSLQRSLNPSPRRGFRAVRCPDEPVCSATTAMSA